MRHKVLKSLCATGALALTLTFGASSAFANTTVPADHTLPPGTHFYVDPNSVQYVGGAQIDYVDSLYGSGFSINNPNSKGSCGCGHSFQA